MLFNARSSTPTHAVYRMTDRDAELLEDMVLLPHKAQGVMHAITCYYGMRTLKSGAELRLPVEPGTVQALKWLAGKLEHIDPIKGPGRFKMGAMAFRDRAGEIAKQIRLDFSEDAEERVSA